MAIQDEVGGQALTIIYKADVIRVHGATCADVAKDSRGAVTVYTAVFNSLTEAAAGFYGDFIGEGSMTVEQAVECSQFLPCCWLPLEQPPCSYCGQSVTSGPCPASADGVNHRPGVWDTWSSASRQHYIEVGRYLTVAEVREFEL